MSPEQGPVQRGNYVCRAVKVCKVGHERYISIYFSVSVSKLRKPIFFLCNSNYFTQILKFRLNKVDTMDLKCRNN
jgi:hypothetical protein